MFLSIQQPEFFPWAGFFNKIKSVDKTVILDNVQFKKRYFENRCTIKVDNQSKWLTIPVKTKGRYSQNICDVFIDNSTYWTKKTWSLIHHNYSKAPFWSENSDFIEKVFLKKQWSKLLDINLYIIAYLCDYLGIRFDYVMGSELDLEYSDSLLILQLCKKMNATKYLSGEFGMNYLDEDEFKREDIQIVYQEFQPRTYPQINKPFVGPLSILDLVMNNGKRSIEYI
jgi:hypothetical protein